MRHLSLILLCLTCLACNKPNQAKQTIKPDTTMPEVVTREAPNKPTSQKLDLSRRERVYELGKLVNLKLLAIHDTIRAERLKFDNSGPQGSGTFIPLIRSFQLYGFQLDATSKDSVQVIIEELRTLHKGGKGWEKTESDLFLVRNGIVVIENLYDVVNVELDSSISGGIVREIFTTALGDSKALLISGEDAYPCYPPCESFKAFGINKVGALMEFPGLHIRQSSELPAMLHDQEIFTSTASRGCINYEVPIRFDSAQCAFFEVPCDSGYDASSPVNANLFENDDRFVDQFIGVFVRQRPTPDSKQEEIVLRRSDSSYVSRLYFRNNELWALLSKNGRVLGWINDAGIIRLRLDACD